MHDQKKKGREEVLSPEQVAAAAAEHERVGKLYASVLHTAKTRSYAALTLEETELLLLAVPEAYTAYNCRRSALERLWSENTSAPTASAAASPAAPTPSSRQEWLRKELKLNSTVLLMNYKNYNAFVHRHWVFDQLEALATAELAQHSQAAAAAERATEGASAAATTSTSTLALLYQLLQKERAQCEQLLQLDERNFHAWNYRRWVLTQEYRTKELERSYHHPAAAADCSAATFAPEEASELAYTTQKIKNNFSNYSAWHQRSLALKAAAARWQPYLTREHTNDDVNVAAAEEEELRRACHTALLRQLREDVGFLSQAIYCDPNDQSAWFYAPFVLQLLQAVAQSSPPSAEEGGAEATALTDALVTAVIELVAEVDRVGAVEEECYMPYYFLLDRLIALHIMADKGAQAAVVRYTDALCVKVASLANRCTGESSRLSCCFRFLHERLCRGDALRKGLYDDMLTKALEATA